MPGIREEFDADLIKTNEPTEYETAENRHELACGGCGRTLSVDAQTLADFERDLEHDLDNQFICFECKQQEYEDSVFE